MEPAPFAFSPPGRAVCRYRLSLEEARAAYGEPHYGEDGPRKLPAWGLRLECGLDIEIQLDAEGEQGLLHCELRELEHALRHLDLGDRIQWRMDDDREAFERALEEYHPVAWDRWIVVERRADGTLQPIGRCLSPADARCRAAELRATGTDAIVEEEPSSRAQARRDALTASLPAKRSRVGTRWEVWWVAEDGAQSLLRLTKSEAEGQQWCATVAGPGAGRWEVRPRK